MNSFEFKLYGREALFSDPVNRIGGEKFSYQIPTYEALKGITKHIHSKPTMIWYIDQIRVMNKIQTHSMGTRTLNYNNGKNSLSIYTYLTDVEYQVKAHFEWNMHLPDFEQDRIWGKHISQFKSALEIGGKLNIVLGVSECQGHVEPCKFGEGKSYFDDYGELNFGLMFHSFDYPDETGIEMLKTNLWTPKMVNGIITFIKPEECTIKRDVRKMKSKYKII